MSPVALALNGLLACLLVAAIWLGWRLERRLRGLRESHAEFARAVGELDRAALRAERGLAELRAASEEATDILSSRLERAREMAARLEALSERAAASVDAHAEFHAGAVARAPRASEELVLTRVSAPVSPPRPAEPARSRAAVDDDLFDAPLRRTAGGRP